MADRLFGIGALLNTIQGGGLGWSEMEKKENGHVFEKCGKRPSGSDTELLTKAKGNV